MNNSRIAMSLLALVLITTGCSSKEETAEDMTHTLAIRSQVVASRVFERRLTVQGTLEAKYFANVASRTDGNLDDIWVDEGDVVVAGETALFQVETTNRQNALTIAEQSLEVAKASLAVAKASAEKTHAEARKVALDFERYSRLHQDGRVSNSEFEAAEVANAQANAAIAVAQAQVDLAERQVKQSEASLAIARKNLDDAQVIAPISGKVSSRTAEPGEQMSVGRVILRIDDLSTVEAAAFIPAQYYAEVIPEKTEIRLSIAGTEIGMFPVTYRSPTINPILRTFEIKAIVGAANGRVVPGNMADIALVFESREALGVPSASILIRNEKPTVFLVQNGKAFSRTVETGIQNDGWTEILSGLEAGEVVVTEGQIQLRDGMLVEVR